MGKRVEIISKGAVYDSQKSKKKLKRKVSMGWHDIGCAYASEDVRVLRNSLQ